MIYRIGSRSNQKVKNLLKEKEKLFFFEGEKLVKDILNRDIKISTLIINEKKEKNINIKGKNIGDLWIVKESVLERISSFKEKSDFIAVLEPKEKEINFSKTKVIIALDNVQDPANAGTVFRCAAAFGIDTIVFAGSGVKPNNSKFLRSAQLSFFDLGFQYFNNIETLIKKSRDKTFNIYLTSSQQFEKTVDVSQIKFPCLIIFGNEGKGLKSGLFERFPSIRISQTNKVESLNVGISACVIMYELMNLEKKQ